MPCILSSTPGIFDLFYLEKMSNKGRSREDAGIITDLVPDLLKEELQVYYHEGKMDESEKSLLVDQILFTVTGLLLFFMNRSYPGDYNEMLEKLDQQIDFILKDRPQAV